MAGRMRRAPSSWRGGAGNALDRLRRRALAPVLQFAADRIAARHPALLERLAPLAGRRILIEAHELPDLVAVEVEGARLRLTLLARAEAHAAAARIAGDLLALVALAEGRVDGDALFFQRRLRIEGETESVVLLRNALDGVEIDLVGDAFPPLRPLTPTLRAVLERGAEHWTRLTSPAARDGAAPRRHG